METRKINLLEILFWIVMIILFIMILTRVFGKSATDFQIYLGFFTGLLIIMGHIVALMSNINNLNREVGELKASMINSFKKAKEDINRLENRVREAISKRKR